MIFLYVHTDKIGILLLLWWDRKFRIFLIDVAANHDLTTVVIPRVTEGYRYERVHPAVCLSGRNFVQAGARRLFIGSFFKFYMVILHCVKMCSVVVLIEKKLKIVKIIEFRLWIRSCIFDSMCILFSLFLKDCSSDRF